MESGRRAGLAATDPDLDLLQSLLGPGGARGLVLLEGYNLVNELLDVYAMAQAIAADHRAQSSEGISVAAASWGSRGAA